MAIQNLVPENTVWVAHDDDYIFGPGVAGYMYLANVHGYVITSSYINNYESLSETLAYIAEETHESGDIDLMIFPEEICYISKVDAQAACEAEP